MLRPTRTPFVLVLIGLSILFSTVAPATAETITAGYRDFSFAATGVAAPTAEKPQSKLWFNDGQWWGSLFNRITEAYNIYRFDWGSQNWVDTGTLIDDRNSSRADTLWDGNTLFIASAIWSGPQGLGAGRLMRYSYDSASKSYSLDPGFPVVVTAPDVAAVEAIVLEKDTTGRLWITYTHWISDTQKAVYVNHSTTDTATWVTPFVPPGGGTTVSDDDISAVVAYRGYIGVMWSNQLDDTIYFAAHRDGDPGDVWQLLARPALRGSREADDHLNLKSLQADDTGMVFAVIKTSRNDEPGVSLDAPVIRLLVLRPNYFWATYVFGTVADGHTRPMMLIDEEHRELYVFATAPEGGGAIYYKKTSLDNIAFEPGRGVPFIQLSSDVRINNATSTKQNLDSTTGLLVLAADDQTGYYVHNTIELGAVAPGPIPVASIAGSAVSEGTGGSTTLPFTVTLSRAYARPVTLAYTTVAGSAGASDFTAQSGNLVIPTGETSGVISVTVAADSVDETDETFGVRLESAQNATITQDTASSTIVDDDGPAFSVDDTRMNELNKTGYAFFTVSLSASSPQTITVKFATQDLEAAAGREYAARSGTLTFKPGSRSQTIKVNVVGDTADEPDERFLLRLSEPTNATLANGHDQGIATIVDDDPIPTVSLTDTQQAEGTGGASNMRFTLSLIGKSDQPITVTYTTVGASATPNADFVTRTGQVVFPARVTSQIVAIKLRTDARDEDDETLMLNLTGATNATIGDGQATGTILDDDSMPLLSVSDATVVEGTGANVYLRFTIALSAVSGRNVSFTYATAPGTASDRNTSTAASDYASLAGSLTFTPGQTLKVVRVSVRGDRVPEEGETLFLTLSAPVNAELADETGAGMITDND